MLKKVMPFFIVLAMVGVIVTLFLSLGTSQQMIVIREGNLEREALKMEPHKHQDSQCGMVIEELDDASQVVAPSGKTWFFHDHGGFILWLEDKAFKDEAVIWVMSRDSKKWIDGREAFYSLTDRTPMGYGFAAYEKKLDGHVEFETMQLKMLRGETMNNPHIRQQLLAN